MKKVVELILLKTALEYRNEYNKIYLHSDAHLYGIPITFHERDFDHIFFEKSISPHPKQFSFRRARRMSFMRELLSGEIEIEVMFENDSGNIALFCQELECVMYLRIIPGKKSLQVGTFFDFGKDHTKMLNKQKRKCIPITIEELNGKVR